MSAAGWDGTAATNTDLLLALGDRANQQAWEVLCARYRPVLVSFGRRLGLSEQDAQDAAQDTLFAFVQAYRQGNYNRSRGRLRSWLFSISSHKIRDVQRRLCRRPENSPSGPGGAVEENLADPGLASNPWELQWQRAILDACLEEAAVHVEPATVEAFKLGLLEGLGVDQVATRLNMSKNAVLKAQRRMLTRMRDTYERIIADE